MVKPFKFPLSPELQALAIKAGVEAEVKLLNISDIKTHADTQSRVELNQDTVAEYAESYQSRASFPPVVVFDDGESHWLADGYHRYEAARLVKLTQIKAEVYKGSLQDAVWHSLGANTTHGLRRTNADKEKVVKTALRLDDYKNQSSRAIADHCGVSHTFVEKIRPQGKSTGNGCQLPRKGKDGKSRKLPSNQSEENYVIKSELSQQPEQTEDYVEDELNFIEPPIKADSTKTITLEDGRKLFIQRSSGSSAFNSTNQMVDWANWTWNPVTGCWHGCNYCYARDIANRFTNGFPNGFEPTFHPDRLAAPANTKVPAGAGKNSTANNVFVCSMADLFGKWVPEEWILQIFEQVQKNPQWNFLFLTKFPQRLQEINDILGGFPDNAWVGTTVDTQARVSVAEKAFANITAKVKWLSCEPLLEPVVFKSLKMFNWIVIGSQSKSSQAPAFQPETKWVADLMHQATVAKLKIYLKENLKIKETPW